MESVKMALKFPFSVMEIGLNIIVGCELTFSHVNYDEYLDKVEKLSSLSHILLIMTE